MVSDGGKAPMEIVVVKVVVMVQAVAVAVSVAASRGVVVPLPHSPCD